MNTELIAYYQNLLLMQYLKPKAKATISALISILMIYDLMIQVRDGYNLETAIGVQLDILGKYLGVSRVVSGFPLGSDYWGYALYSSTFPIPGIRPYSVYGSTPATPGVLSYYDGEDTYTMTDDEYRTIQAMALRRRTSAMSIDTIDNVMFPVFGTNYAAFEAPMVINYKIQTEFARMAQLVSGSGLIPHPMGVLITLTIEDTISS